MDLHYTDTESESTDFDDNAYEDEVRSTFPYEEATKIAQRINLSKTDMATFVNAVLNDVRNDGVILMRNGQEVPPELMYISRTRVVGMKRKFGKKILEAHR